MPIAIKQRKTQEGFTLIEIMVVLVILGALAVISVPVYSNYVRRAKITEAISNVEAYATAARIYRMEKGWWPATQAVLNAGDFKVVDVDDNYFKIEWNNAGQTNATTSLEIKVTNKNFDVPGSFKYTLDTNYKGQWLDVTGKLLSTYAPYIPQPTY